MREGHGIAHRSPVVLVDLGDNIGGGSAGDGTVLLREILRQGAAGAVVALYDPDAVADAAQVGARRHLPTGDVGGRVDRMHGEPVEVRGVVRSLHDGKWEEDQPRHGGRRFNDQGATAVVDLDGGNTLVLELVADPALQPRPAHQPGNRPGRPGRSWSSRPPSPTRPPTPRSPAGVIEVDTPGLTAVDPARFAYKHRRVPMYPFELSA